MSAGALAWSVGALIDMGDEAIVVPPLELRPRERVVTVDGVHVPLTAREFEVFLVLARAAGRVVTRRAIYAEVWNGPMPRRDRAVDVFVRKVRLKLAAAAPGWKFIHTHFAIGYRLAPEPLPS